MGAANKSIFSKVAESISSKLIRCNNNFISNNPSPGFRYIPKRQHKEQPTNNMNLLLRRCVNAKAKDESINVHYFSMLASYNNGRHFSLGKNYYLRNHGFEDALVGGSCNGILCLEDKNHLGNVVLWNPFTDELKSLPPSSHLSHPEADQTRFKSSGFGFDAGSQDYKVVRLVQNSFSHDNGKHKNTTNHYELYSLKTDSWRPIDNPEINSWYSNPTYLKEFYYARWYRNPICLKGSCYWYSWGFILSFNFVDEVFSSVPLPAPDIISYSLLDFDGSLGAIAYPFWVGRGRFDLFVWNNESWSKVDSFVLDGVSKPLGFWGSDKCFLEGTNDELLLFDLTTRELKPLGIKDCPLTMQLFSFVESTVSINGHSKVEELHTEERKEESGSNEGSSNDITTDETSNFG